MCLEKTTGAIPGNKEYVDQLLAVVFDISTLLKKQILTSKPRSLDSQLEERRKGLDQRLRYLVLEPSSVTGNHNLKIAGIGAGVSESVPRNQ